VAHEQGALFLEGQRLLVQPRDLLVALRQLDCVALRALLRLLQGSIPLAQLGLGVLQLFVPGRNLTT
jgi:hypothetical protein